MKLLPPQRSFINRFDVLRSVTDELMTRFPRDSRSHYYAAVVSGVEGNWMRRNGRSLKPAAWGSRFPSSKDS